MKNVLTFFIILCVGFFGHAKAYTVEKSVLVSVAPYTDIVSTIAGNQVQVLLLVPQGVSFHSYDPSPKQLQEVLSCAVWFCIGDPFEKKGREVFGERNPKMSIVDLRQGLDLIHEHACHHHHHHHEHAHDEGSDPHIWMSARLMQQQVETIYTALTQAFPEDQEHFARGRQKVLDELKQVDLEIQKVLSNISQKMIFVSHPAYGYFCRDYGLSEKSIEQEGKEPGPRYITEVLKQAKLHQIKTIFAQPQYPIKSAHMMAKLLNVDVVMLNPYSEEYFSNMRLTAKSFSEALE